ncbi:unnamed protein product [Ophioblennius macclurei]
MFGVLVVLTGSSQTGGQSTVLPPSSTPAILSSHTETPESPDTTEDPENEAPQWTHNLASENEMLVESTTGTPQSQETFPSHTQTNAVLTLSSAAPTNMPFTTSSPSDAASSPAAAEGLSSTPAEPLTTSLEYVSTPDGTDPPQTGVSLTTVSSQPTHAGMDGSSTAPTPTSTAQTESESLSTDTWKTTGRPQTSAPGPEPAGPTHREGPSELNVGDEELKRSHYHSRSRLDPLLAGLLSVFIVSTAIVFVVLFLKFRQRTNHPEFHRLQDLPMDDLMEDTPLSRYSY